MQFLSPTYLWALIALAIPIAIHFWSRKKVRVIKVGSTQFLENLNPKQTSSIKLNEIILLILRLLSIMLLTLILARPQFKNTIKNSPITYLIEPSLLLNERITKMLDSIPKESIRLLEKGFPPYHQNTANNRASKTPDYWQLAIDMEELTTDSIVVFANAYQSGIKGMRPEISVNVNWISIDDGEIREGIVEAVDKEAEITLLKVSGDSRFLIFSKEVEPKNSDLIKITNDGDSVLVEDDGRSVSLPLQKEDPIKVSIVYEESLTDQMRFIQSAYRAMGTYLDRQVEIQVEKADDNLNTSNYDNLIWLTGKPLKKYSGKALVYHPDSLSTSLITLGNLANVWHLTRNLNSQNIIKEHVVEQLMELHYFHPRLKDRIIPYDARVLDVAELRPVVSNLRKNKTSLQLFDISPWLWVFLVIVLLAERIIAKYRRQ
ncbi:BatA domain-containing protein [Maribacter halichondriae]|uniref:BatA domain-containing protein n=1 Tax=Maribacter halichondriae TaxID=2980554 RepID=UPI0023591985|nr:BatA domain-containing protein [Maribacter sp. Hal144]